MYYSLLNEGHKYKVKEQNKTCLGTNVKTCTITGGNTLGGRSTINNMIYARGALENYDHWAYGTWKGTLVQRAFDEMEENLNLTVNHYEDDTRRMLYELYAEVGHKRENYVGVTDHYVMIKDGSRLNMAEVFLNPIKNRKNLIVSLNSEVIKVNIEKHRQVEGVDVYINGIKRTIGVRKEVILTAGPVQNPKLLLLSGVGERMYLAKRNIKMKSELKGIGMNLQLHLGLPLFISYTACPDLEPDETCDKDIYDEFERLSDIYEYVMHRRGNLSTLVAQDFVTYINSRHVGVTCPDIGLYHTHFPVKDPKLDEILIDLHMAPLTRRRLMLENERKSILLLTIALLNPDSRGQVYLNDTHYEGDPVVDTMMFSDESNQDFRSLYKAFDHVVNLTETSVLKSRNATLVDIDVPHCRNFKFCTPHYVKCYIRSMITIRKSVCCTTKMGHLNNHFAVVDMKMRVLKINGLRVGDSSVMPTITFENTMSSDAMFGYRLGEIIKGDWLEDYHSEFTINDTEVH